MSKVDRPETTARYYSVGIPFARMEEPVADPEGYIAQAREKFVGRNSLDLDAVSVTVRGGWYVKYSLPDAARYLDNRVGDYTTREDQPGDKSGQEQVLETTYTLLPDGSVRIIPRRQVRVRATETLDIKSYQRGLFSAVSKMISSDFIFNRAVGLEGEVSYEGSEARQAPVFKYVEVRTGLESMFRINEGRRLRQAQNIGDEIRSILDLKPKENPFSSWRFIPKENNKNPKEL